MIKPGHMRMPRGKGGQVDPSIKSSVKRVTGTGLNSDSVHTGKASGGGGGLGRRRLVALAGDGTREWNGGDLELAP